MQMWYIGSHIWPVGQSLVVPQSWTMQLEVDWHDVPP
jgi:hypothetical protein